MPSRIQLLRLSAVLPVVVPAFLYGIVRVFDASGRATPGLIGFLFALSFTAIWAFWVAYLVLVLAILILLRRQSWQTHRNAALAAPLLMVLPAETYAFVTNPDRISVSDAMKGGLVIALFCLVVGYGYVVVALFAIEAISAVSERRKPAN